MAEGNDIVGYREPREKGDDKIRWICYYTKNAKGRISFVKFTSRKEIACRVNSEIAGLIVTYLRGNISKLKECFIERVK